MSASLVGSRGNTVAEKRVDFGCDVLGQFTSIARYKDTDGGTVAEQYAVDPAGTVLDNLGRATKTELWSQWLSLTVLLLAVIHAGKVASIPNSHLM